MNPNRRRSRISATSWSVFSLTFLLLWNLIIFELQPDPATMGGQPQNYGYGGGQYPQQYGGGPNQPQNFGYGGGQAQPGYGGFQPGYGGGPNQPQDFGYGGGQNQQPNYGYGGPPQNRIYNVIVQRQDPSALRIRHHRKRHHRHHHHQEQQDPSGLPPLTDLRPNMPPVYDQAPSRRSFRFETRKFIAKRRGLLRSSPPSHARVNPRLGSCCDWRFKDAS